MSNEASRAAFEQMILRRAGPNVKRSTVSGDYLDNRVALKWAAWEKGVAWARTAHVEQGGEGYTWQQVAQACINADVPDSVYESIAIELNRLPAPVALSDEEIDEIWNTTMFSLGGIRYSFARAILAKVAS